MLIGRATYQLEKEYGGPESICKEAAKNNMTLQSASILHKHK